MPKNSRYKCDIKAKSPPCGALTDSLSLVPPAARASPWTLMGLHLDNCWNKCQTELSWSIRASAIGKLETSITYSSFIIHICSLCETCCTKYDAHLCIKSKVKYSRMREWQRSYGTVVLSKIGQCSITFDFFQLSFRFFDPFQLVEPTIEVSVIYYTKRSFSQRIGSCPYRHHSESYSTNKISTP
jgi:hypothetical protein